MEPKCIKNFGKSGRGRSQWLLKIFRAPIYRANRAVIFAVHLTNWGHVPRERGAGVARWADVMDWLNRNIFRSVPLMRIIASAVVRRQRGRSALGGRQEGRQNRCDKGASGISRHLGAAKWSADTSPHAIVLWVQTLRPIECEGWRRWWSKTVHFDHLLTVCVLCDHCS